MLSPVNRLNLFPAPVGALLETCGQGQTNCICVYPSTYGTWHTGLPCTYIPYHVHHTYARRSGNAPSRDTRSPLPFRVICSRPYVCAYRLGVEQQQCPVLSNKGADLVITSRCSKVSPVTLACHFLWDFFSSKTERMHACVPWGLGISPDKTGMQSLCTTAQADQTAPRRRHNTNTNTNTNKQ